MAEKQLTEAEWRKSAKGGDYKDAAFVKALASLDRAKGPDEELQALQGIEKQAGLLRKATQGDAGLASYWRELDKALSRTRQLCEQAIQKAASQAGAEDEESPADLTTKLIPLLRQIRKGEQFPALLALAGREVAVLISRRSISPTKRKLLADYLGVSGGVKFINGQCLFEENAHTFVVATQAAGLAKKIKAALLAQTEMRCKVRVRGEAPDDIDDDDDEAEAETPDSDNRSGDEAVRQASEQRAEPDAQQRAFETRMRELEPRILAALKARAGDTGKIRAVADFVQGKAEGGNFKAALQGLDALNKLLPTMASTATAATEASQTSAWEERLAQVEPRYLAALKQFPKDATKLRAVMGFATEAADGGQIAKGVAALVTLENLIREAGAAPAQPAEPVRTGVVNYARCRLAWEEARKRVHGDLLKLEHAITEVYQTHPAFPKNVGKLRKLDEVLALFEEDLSDLLDRAYVETQPAVRQSLHAEAAGVIRKFLARVEGDAFIARLDTNPFTPIAVQATLTSTLNALARQIA